MKKEKKKQTTLRAIAQACGVSIMTVSRAFKDSRLLDPQTRAMILTTAAQKGYQPDGRMGRPRRHEKITRHSAQVIIDMNLGDGTSLFHAYLLGAIERTLAQREHDCILRTYDGTYDNFIWLCELLRSTPPWPTMVLGDFPLDHLRTLLTLCPEALLVDNAENPHLTCPYNSIGFDNVEAARMAVRHLHETGKRRVLLLKGNPSHFFSREIERGYRDVHQINGVKIDEALINTADFTSAGAYRTINGIFKRRLFFDAVFTNDEMALGVMKAMREHGKQAPADIAVCGCDGLPFGAFLEPPLSTVVLDYAELGKATVEHLLSPNNKTSMPARIKLVPKLEVKGSTLHR